MRGVHKNKIIWEDKVDIPRKIKAINWNHLFLKLNKKNRLVTKSGMAVHSGLRLHLKPNVMMIGIKKEIRIEWWFEISNHLINTLLVINIQRSTNMRIEVSEISVRQSHSPKKFL